MYVANSNVTFQLGCRFISWRAMATPPPPRSKRIDIGGAVEVGRGVL